MLNLDQSMNENMPHNSKSRHPSRLNNNKRLSKDRTRMNIDREDLEINEEEKEGPIGLTY
jgi:hypothetical protein